ncbi:hypothetical protein AALP_AAs48252U001500 [Arabis alpina]|uniref:DUF1204 domain-containing protein n=1 Tax=Arabis alpina TaxID=50452 RepID=A0A087FWG3_ARAAL|nr:hypothetical protein AALP_AAs48252U001500 [Arabis alpina]
MDPSSSPRGKRHSLLSPEKDLVGLASQLGFPPEVELATPTPDDTPEMIRPGWCCPHPSYFLSCGLTLPVSIYLIRLLRSLGLAFPQMNSNFLRHTVGMFVRAFEEGIVMSTKDFLTLYMAKRNSRVLGSFYPSNWPDRRIVTECSGPSSGRLRFEDVFAVVQSVFEVARVADHDVSTVRSTDTLVVAPESDLVKQVSPANAAEVPLAVVRPSTRSSSGLLPHPKRANPGPLTDLDPMGLAHLFCHVKPGGCSIPVVKNLHLRRPHVKLTLALGKAIEAFNAYVAVAENRLRDVPRKGEVDGMKKILEEVASKLTASHNENVKLVADLDVMVGQANDVAVLNRELEVENRSLKESGDTIARKASRAGHRDLGVDSREVLPELVANMCVLEDLAKKEVTMESKTARLIVLRPAEEAAFQRSIISDFSLGKLALPQISKDSNAAVMEVDSSTRFLPG